MKDEILPDRRGTREDDFLRDIPGTVPYGFRGRDKSIDGDNPFQRSPPNSPGEYVEEGRFARSRWAHQAQKWHLGGRSRTDVARHASNDDFPLRPLQCCQSFLAYRI